MLADPDRRYFRSCSGGTCFLVKQRSCDPRGFGAITDAKECSWVAGRMHDHKSDIKRDRGCAGEAQELQQVCEGDGMLMVTMIGLSRTKAVGRC